MVGPLSLEFFFIYNALYTGLDTLGINSVCSATDRERNIVRSAQNKSGIAVVWG